MIRHNNHLLREYFKREGKGEKGINNNHDSDVLEGMDKNNKIIMWYGGQRKKLFS